ncbi:MAG: hypothetical protein BWY85_00206 [Firmicutes bacterium ADurb.Bin506]|nr:MAG: hypothetical protein BWY85_00206 [Firmicutes bacterium ADurb.Bin506]
MKLYISYLVRHIVLAQMSLIGQVRAYTIFNFIRPTPPDRVIPDWSHDP